jgi:haloalkane dehalogenase
MNIRRRDVIAATGGLIVASTLFDGARAETMSAASVLEDSQEAQRYDRERKYADLAFGRIAYVERGQGSVALFLHGFPLSSFQWRGVINRLSEHRRCLVPDFMGLGYSEVTEKQSVAPAAQADMLLSLLDHFGIRDVDIIANDCGGAVAQLFAAKWPDRVRTLLLTNGDVETDSPPEAILPIIEMARAGLYTELYLEPWLHHKDVMRSSAGFGELCYSNSSHPTDAAIEQYIGPLVSSPARKALTNRFTVSLAPNPLAGIASALRKCSAPTRIVWGMSDTIFSSSNIEYLISVLPRVSGVRRVQEGKLFFPEEFPDVIAEEAQRLWVG